VYVWCVCVFVYVCVIHELACPIPLQTALVTSFGYPDPRVFSSRQIIVPSTRTFRFWAPESFKAGLVHLLLQVRVSLQIWPHIRLLLLVTSVKLVDMVADQLSAELAQHGLSEVLVGRLSSEERHEVNRHGQLWATSGSPMQILVGTFNNFFFLISNLDESTCVYLF